MKNAIYILLAILYPIMGTSQTTWHHIYSDNSERLIFGGGGTLCANNEVFFPFTINLGGTGLGAEYRIAKFDAQGELIFSKPLRDTIPRFSYNPSPRGSITQISENSFIIVGSKKLDTINQSTDSSKIFCMKIDKNADVLQYVEFYVPFCKNAYFQNMIYTADFNLVFTGEARLIATNNLQMMMMSIDTNLNVNFIKTYGNFLDREIGYGIDRLADGGYILSGLRQYQSNGFYRKYLVKTDAQGNFQWERFFDISSPFMGGGLATALPDGDFIITSASWRETELYSDLILTKFSSDGDSLWSKRYMKGNETEHASGNRCLIQADGSIVILASFYDSTITNSPNGGRVGWLIKTDADGEVIWERELNYFADSLSTQFVTSNTYYYLQGLPDGGFFVSGTISTASMTGQTFYITYARLDEFGCVQNQCANYTSIEELLTEAIPEFQMKVYPNPANISLNLDLQNFEQNSNLYYKISDLSGRLLIAEPLLQTNNSIDVSSFTNGLYLLEIYENNTLKEVFKFIKE